MSEFTASLLLTALPEEGGVEYQHIPFRPVDEARNILAKMFLKTDKEYLLFVDNDCIFEPQSINRLLSHNVPMVCGGMWHKSVPPRPTIGKFLGITAQGREWYDTVPYLEKLTEYLGKHDIGSIPRNDVVFDEPELYEIGGGCGMHFTMIRRDVFESINKPYFVMNGKTGAGEDFYFCKKVMDAGIPIYTDLSVHTGHSAGEQTDFGLREFLVCLRIAKTGELGDNPKWRVDYDPKQRIKENK